MYLYITINFEYTIKTIKILNLCLLLSRLNVNFMIAFAGFLFKTCII